MRTTPRKTKNQFQWPHCKDEQRDKQNRRSWTDMLLLAKCCQFCSSSDTMQPPQKETTTPNGSQTCNIINGEHSRWEEESCSSHYDKQSSNGKSCYDTPTKCSKAYEGCGSHETERRDSETHLYPQYADGVRQAARGELAAFRARCASLESNEPTQNHGSK